MILISVFDYYHNNFLSNNSYLYHKKRPILQMHYF